MPSMLPQHVLDQVNNWVSAFWACGELVKCACCNSAIAEVVCDTCGRVVCEKCSREPVPYFNFGVPRQMVLCCYTSITPEQVVKFYGKQQTKPMERAKIRVTV